MITPIRPDFYMLGSRYYNSDECYETSYLNHFTYSKNPMKNTDQLVKMTMKVKKTGAMIDVGAYFTSDKKSELADSHAFFKNLRFSGFKKQEKRYFPQKMDCFKDVNNWLFGFGFFDVYGVAWQLNPTIDEYVATSQRGSRAMTFLDLFSIFLDVFRGLEIVFKNDYYIGDFGDDDIGINLFTEEDSTTTVQGRLRKLYDFKKGSETTKCDAINMTNYYKNKELYLANSGKRQVTKNTITLCQAINLGDALDVFERYAAKAVLTYHPDKSSNFSHCFDEMYQMHARCPDALKPIWDNKNMRYLYRSMRKLVMKWTSSSMVTHLINMFELLKNQEILRLTQIEKERLEKLKKEEEDRIRIQKEKELRKVLAENIRKLMEEQRQIKEQENLENQSENQSMQIDHSPSIRESEVNSNASQSQSVDHNDSPNQRVEVVIHKKVKDERSETTDHFIQEYNIEHSIQSSEVSETIKQEEKDLQKKLMEEQNRIKDQMKEIINDKMNQTDLDDDRVEIGNVKNPHKKIIENTEEAILLEEQKIKLMDQFKEKLENEIRVLSDESVKNLEIKRMNSIEEIMNLKDNIDKLKEKPQTFEIKQELDNNIDEINTKIDLAIRKYGSDREIVNSNQVVITLGTLKRELDPYYLKSKIQNFGTLEIQNGQNDFIFL
jgi:hypothetical protein